MNNKTVFLIGSGSTAKLGIPMTQQQDDLVWKLANDDSPLLKKLDLILHGLFGDNGENKRNYIIGDVYNLIDSSLVLHSALTFDSVEISPFEMEKCKRDLIVYIFKEFLQIIKKNFTEKQDEYNKLVDFYYELAKRELKAKIKETTEWSDRDSFISSYSIVNFNWDIYSLLPIIEANNRLNHSNSNYLSIGRNPQLRMFTDFNCEYAVANETKENPFWYPFTESAAFVVNEDKYDAKRRVVLTKCYYPHGAMNLFKCTVCAKHSYYLGDLTLKSVAEKLQYQNEKERLYNCPYCGNRITSFDFDILAQSNFKIRNSYLEEIRLSLTKELRDAKRLVFIGYSLPPDDVDYKTLYKSLNNVEEVYIILFSSDKRIENKFVPYAALPEEVQKTLNTFDEAFRNKKVLYNMKGVPEALDEYLRITVD